MLHFSPSEHDRQLHFVTFFQEFPDLISLGIEVTFCNLRSIFEFLYYDIGAFLP